MDLSSILLAADAADALQSPPPMLTIINCALAIRRESAAISTGNKKQTPSDRELAHVRSEQKRRNNISDGFYDLRQSIPFCDGVVDSKSSTLRKAVNYIKHLEVEVARLKQEVSSSNNRPPRMVSPISPPFGPSSPIGPVGQLINDIPKHSLPEAYLYAKNTQ